MRDLTPRQRQIAEGLARGLSYAEVAAELGIATQTVKEYVTQAAERIPNPHRFQPRVLLILWATERKAG